MLQGPQSAPSFYLIFLVLLSACTGSSTALTAIIPTETLPAAIARTLPVPGIKTIDPAAASASPGTTTHQAATTKSETACASEPVTTVVRITATSKATRSAPTATGHPVRSTVTLAPSFPQAIVKIDHLGELSRVTSPLHVTTHLLSKWGKVVRIELYSEDGNLLARYLRTFRNLPWDTAQIDFDLKFETSTAEETGRLVVSVEDPFDRLIDVNSVNLILLSGGFTRLSPITALTQRLIITEPQPKALIHGGNLTISGRALPDRSDQPLRVMLVAEDGRVLGQRLAQVEVEEPGKYGSYVAEVPYTVRELTPARLVIYEEGEPVSDIAHLSSIEVVLAP